MYLIINVTSMKALYIKLFWLVLVAFIDAHCLHLCSLPSFVLIAFIGAQCLHWCSLSSLVLMSSLVLIAFIIARTNEGMHTKQIFWVPFETAHKWKTHQWKPHEPRTWCRLQGRRNWGGGRGGTCPPPQILAI